MKILSFFLFFGSFLPSWIRILIRNLYADPDPAAQINADPCGSGKPCYQAKKVDKLALQVLSRLRQDARSARHIYELS